MSVHLGAYSELVSDTLRQLNAERVARRIWNRDHTVWKPGPDGIIDRLGWLDLPTTMRNEMSAISTFADEVTLAGFRHVVLFGMGGSSLAAEVLRQTCAPNHHPLKLIVLDSTIPEAVLGDRRRDRPGAHALHRVVEVGHDNRAECFV